MTAQSYQLQFRWAGPSRMLPKPATSVTNLTRNGEGDRKSGKIPAPAHGHPRQQRIPTRVIGIRVNGIRVIEIRVIGIAIPRPSLSFPREQEEHPSVGFRPCWRRSRFYCTKVLLRSRSPRTLSPGGAHALRSKRLERASVRALRCPTHATRHLT